MAEHVIFSQIKHANLLTICLKVIPSCQLCVDLLSKKISPYKQPQAKHHWMYATGILRASHLLDIISQKDKIQIWRNCELWRFKSRLWEEQEYEMSEFLGAAVVFTMSLFSGCWTHTLFKLVMSWCSNIHTLIDQCMELQQNLSGLSWVKRLLFPKCCNQQKSLASEYWQNMSLRYLIFFLTYKCCIFQQKVCLVGMCVDFENVSIPASKDDFILCRTHTGIKVICNVCI